MSKTPKTKSAPIDPASWRKGSVGFFRFLEDVQPMVRDGRGGWVAYSPSGKVRDEIAKAIDGGYGTVCFSWPRRWGKSTASAMILLWRFIVRPNESIAVVANSTTQAVDVAFRMLLDALKRTPFLRELVSRGEIKLGAERIEAPEIGSVIQAFSNNSAAMFGKKLSGAMISELHATTSAATLEAIAGSLLDTANSLLLCDSTVAPASSPLYELFNASKNSDSGVYFSHVSHENLEDACANSPEWIDRKKLRALSRTMLPQQFALLHLNRWSDASSSLFSAEVIARCTDSDYLLDPKAIAAGSPFVVGGGLDRAFGMSLHGDSTVTSCVVKVMHDEDEHFYVLASDAVAFSRLGGIRANFAKYERDFSMSRVGIESYNSQDVFDWLTQQPYGKDAELIHVTRQRKAAAFTSLWAAANEGRLHIHPSFSKLLDEMRTFECTFDGKRSNGSAAAEDLHPRFQHAAGAHDDFLHSLLWAFYSLRDQPLNQYQLDGISCFGTEPNVSLCVLNGGQIVPFACGDSCRSMHEARRLHEAYLSRNPVCPLPLDEFVISRVKNVGPHSLPR
jgi:hypothetical protein